MFLRHTRASGVIPQIAVILGPCSGGACYAPAICDFIFMVKDISKMFITGPNVVKTVINEEVTAEELGGAEVHAKRSGVSHFSYETEGECLMGVRKLLSYLPANYKEKAPVVKPIREKQSFLFAVNRMLGRTSSLNKILMQEEKGKAQRIYSRHIGALDGLPAGIDIERLWMISRFVPFRYLGFGSSKEIISPFPSRE